MGQACETSLTQCHNFGFQYDASAPIIICNGANCGGFIGCVSFEQVTLTQCSLRRRSIIISGVFPSCIFFIFLFNFASFYRFYCRRFHWSILWFSYNVLDSSPWGSFLPDWFKCKLCQCWRSRWITWQSKIGHLRFILQSFFQFCKKKQS